MLFELTIEPIGTGETHYHELIARIVAVIRSAGLTFELHAMGTNIEGEWKDVIPVVKRCLDVAYAEGARRLEVTLRISDRHDDTPNTIRRSEGSVQALLGGVR